MKIKLLILVLFFSITALFSQEASFSPFPSRLKIYKNGSDIILTWRDSQDLENESYLIFRAGFPIDEENYGQLDAIAEVDSGIMIYTDKPENSGDFYYAIICKDENQKNYPIFLPYRNTLAKVVTLEETVYQEKNAGLVEDLTVSIMDNQIGVKFSATDENRRYGIYRSTSEINSREVLPDSQLLRILDNGQFYYLDSPIPGIAYYYAVVDYELINDSSDKILYPGNYSTRAIELPITQYLGDNFVTVGQRRAPLPELRLEKFYSELPLIPSNLPSERTIAQSLEIKISNRFPQNKKENTLEIEPELLPLEMSQSSHEIERKLQWILNEGSFKQQQWSPAIEELMEILQMADDPFLRARIFFYRGQCNFFLNHYEESMLDFIISKEYYTSYTEKWIKLLYQIN